MQHTNKLVMKKEWKKQWQKSQCGLLYELNAAVVVWMSSIKERLESFPLAWNLLKMYTLSSCNMAWYLSAWLRQKVP
jgi:hypothetical protein